MSGSPPVWWPVPADPTRWFSVEELERSARRHGPVVRATIVRHVVQWSATLAIAVAASRTSAGAVPAVIALTAAWWVPLAVVDAWRELRHEPRVDGRRVGLPAVVVTLLGHLVAIAAALALGAWILHRRSDDRVVVIVVVAAALVPFLTSVIGPRIILRLHRAQPVTADHSVRRVVDAWADGGPPPEVVMVSSDVVDGLNAFCTGGSGARTVAVSEALLHETSPVREHVIAHELAHLRRRHLAWSTVASTVAVGIVVIVAFLVIEAVDPVAGAALPWFLLVVGVIAAPFRLFLAWLSRANERRADVDAAAWCPVTPSQLRILHADGPMLDPGRLARLVAMHPAPAERLALAERLAERRI